MVTHQVLNYLPKDLTSVLDVGCGVGTMGLLIKANYLTLDPKHPRMKCNIYSEAIEYYSPYVDYCKDANIYDDIKNIDLSLGLLPYDDNSFDLVLLDNMINHFEKSLSYELINECKRVAKKRVIIATCDVEHAPEEESIENDGNIGLEHKSTWNLKELKHLDFKVYGVGMKLFGDGHGHYPKGMKMLGKQLELVATKFPTLGNRMVAYHDIKHITHS